MRRLDRVLSRVAERGDPLGADLLIDHLERKLAGEPDPIVVARQRSGIMQTFEQKTDQQPGPPPRRKGLAVALVSFIVVLLAGGSIFLWTVFDDDEGSEASGSDQATTVATTTETPSTTTQTSSTTQEPPVVVDDAVGTFTFDGTTWSYDGPSTIEAGLVTFSLVNTSSQEAGVWSSFGWLDLEGELEAELARIPVGTDIGPYEDAPPAPDGVHLGLVEADPGETTSATAVMAVGWHLIDAATYTATSTDNLWRIALIEVVEPEVTVPGDAVGTFTFDGTTWSYDGPSTIEAGFVTFSLVNTSSEEVGVYSFFGLDPENELLDALEAYPVGTDIGPYEDAPPAPDGVYLELAYADPGETTSATAVMAVGWHLIDAATYTADGTDNLWRVALIEVIEP